ncbi:MAG TPA: DUF2336 domain-containing protein [Aestuariivirgaceae bacterium]
MSQFAAQEQGEDRAAPRHGGLEAPPSTPKPKHRKRATADAFRQLKQRLASTSLADLLGPPPADGPADPVPPESDPPSLQPTIASTRGPPPLTTADASRTNSVSRDTGEPFAIGDLPDGSSSRSPVEIHFSPLDRAEGHAQSSIIGAGYDGSFSLRETALENLACSDEDAPAALPDPHSRDDYQSAPVASVEQSPRAEASLPALRPDELQADEEIATGETALRLLLEPELPSLDEFAAVHVGQFFAAPSEHPEASHETTPEPQSDSVETSRPPDYRFWEAELEPDVQTKDEELVDETLAEFERAAAVAPDPPPEPHEREEIEVELLARPFDLPEEKLSTVSLDLVPDAQETVAQQEAAPESLPQQVEATEEEATVTPAVAPSAQQEAAPESLPQQVEATQEEATVTAAVAPSAQQEVAPALLPQQVEATQEEATVTAAAPPAEEAAPVLLLQQVEATQEEATVTAAAAPLAQEEVAPGPIEAIEADVRLAGPQGDESGLDPKRQAEARRRAAIHRQENEEPSEEASEVARSLLEIMSLPNNATQPQERALAADTLLQLLRRLPVKSLVAMAERLSFMEAPPPLILAQLIHDQRIEVAGPLLEKCSAINDHDLMEVIADGNEQSNRMIARRRSLSSVLCDTLIATENPSTVLTLVRNPGAVISHEAFLRLNELATQHSSLQAPLATRSDLPAPIAFELFWVLPVELRRYVISRFLTDSSTLTKILKLTMRMENELEEAIPERFPPREEVEAFIESLKLANRVEAEKRLAGLLGLQPATAARILADQQGEPLTVALKAAGATRARFEEIFAALETTHDNCLQPKRSANELQSFFESLSFNKARVLLTYWDWAVLRTGPYTTLSAGKPLELP